MRDTCKAVLSTWDSLSNSIIGYEQQNTAKSGGNICELHFRSSTNWNFRWHNIHNTSKPWAQSDLGLGLILQPRTVALAITKHGPTPQHHATDEVIFLIRFYIEIKISKFWIWVVCYRELPKAVDEKAFEDY